MKKKLFVFSDIHGHYTEFIDALNKSGYEKNNQDHYLIFCGDMFDRGNENISVLKFLENAERCIAIRGNHEDMLLKVLTEGKMREHNFYNGTASTIYEFFGAYSIDSTDKSIDLSGKTRTVDRICDFILSMCNFFETKNYIFTHGWLPHKNGVILSDWKNADDSLWEKARFTKWTDVLTQNCPINGKTLICGHMPTVLANIYDSNRSMNDSTPYCSDGFIAIDAGVFNTGNVNILILEDELL